jgi:peptide/nickel transport system substrate-binding protein
VDESNFWQRRAHLRLQRRCLLSSGVVLIGGYATLGLVGCSSSSNNKASTAGAAITTSPPPRTPAAALTPTPVTGPSAASSSAALTPLPAGSFKTGGTIQGVTLGTGTLNPFENTNSRSQQFASFHYSRLFRFNSGPDPSITLSRTPVPDLVTGYEASVDGLTYTMKLRQDATFHPPLNRPLTSADVLASWQYFTTNAKNINKDVYTPIVDSLTTPDDHTLVFKLKQPYAPFLNKLANPQYLWIMSQDAVAGTIDPGQQPIGTGPWIFASGSATAYTWKRNPAYFVKGLPYADGVTLNIIPDLSTQEAQFQAGAIDLLTIGPSDVGTMQKAVPKAHVDEYTPDSISYFFFGSVMDPTSPFGDVRMRRAASLAIDRDGLIGAIYNGKGAWDNIINPGLGKWYLDPHSAAAGDSAQWFKYDPQQAKQLIAAAGHASTPFRYFYPNNAYGDVYNSTADALRGMLSAAGFQLQVLTVDYLKDWVDSDHGYAVKGLPKDGIGYAVQTPFTDPDDFLTGLLTKTGNRAQELLDDPDLNMLIHQEQVELDENKRLQLVYQVQVVHGEKMYYPPLISSRSYALQQPWVKNHFVVDEYNIGAEEYAYTSVNNK